MRRATVHQGGGPAHEHCYTQGLLYHYYLTGCRQSRDALLGLVEWMIRIHEMPSTLIGKLFVLKTKGLPTFKRVVVRHEKLPAYRYPFNRGTGNFISTLIDAYQISGDDSYIHRAELVIRSTVHPNDDINSRNLKDVESRWSYTVLLQSLIKFLDLKVERNELDDLFIFVRDSFLAYADWIRDNEETYLSKSDSLDYVNLTWVAQEIRKANILSCAYKYSGGTNRRYLNRADFFFNYVVEKIKGHEEASFTRILVILMQNFGPYDAIKESEQYNKFSSLPVVSHGNPTLHTKGSLARQFFSELLKGLRNFSLIKEYHWLRFRL